MLRNVSLLVRIASLEGPCMPVILKLFRSPSTTLPSGSTHCIERMDVGDRSSSREIVQISV